MQLYSQTCTADTDCIAANTLKCLITDFGTVYGAYTSATRTVCRCDSTTQYYDEVSNKCKSYLTYHAICAYRRECLNRFYFYIFYYITGTQPFHTQSLKIGKYSKIMQIKTQKLKSIDILAINNF